MLPDLGYFIHSLSNQLWPKQFSFTNIILAHL